jgi:hypothetical protein
MNCKNTKTALEKFEEGEAINNDVIMAHINSCESCGREYRAAVQIRESFDSIKAPEAGGNFNLKVWEKIGEVSPSPLGSILSAIRKPFVFIPAAALAAFVLVFVSTIQMKKTVLPQHDNMETAVKQTARNVRVAVLPVKHIKKHISSETADVKSAVAVGQAGTEKTVQQEPVMASFKPAVPNKEAESASFSNDDRSGVQGAAFSRQGGSASVSSASKQPDQAAVKPGTDQGVFKSRPEIKTPLAAVKPVEIKNNVINVLNNEKLVIRYRIDTSVDAVITIYDRTGKPVKQFVGSKQPGVYSFEWGGEGDNGVLLGAGIYIIHVKTDITDTKFKAAIIK